MTGSPWVFGREACLVPGAQHGPDPGVQHPRLDRLDHVVVVLGLQTADDVQVPAASGQHDDRHLAGTPQPPGHLQAVQAGQHHVQQDHVGRGGAETIERRLAGHRAAPP